MGYKKKYVGYGERVTVLCADRRKTILKLNRTRIDIRVTENCDSRLEALNWYLSALGTGEGHFKIEWNDEASYFKVKSVDETPFIHNGVESFDSIIRFGDYVDFGRHRLIFSDREASERSSRSLPFQYWPEKVSILLMGETGTGKSSLAKKIHHNLHQKETPFVQVNLSAYSEHLLESELFGHEKGAFTGADRLKRGAIELAANGTLFIDEIDSLSKSLQLKLLLFLDDQVYRRVGGEKELKAHCRLIFASGRTMEECYKDGSIRPDFYFRINSGFRHQLRPLRGDQERIKVFIQRFLDQHSLTMNDELMQFLQDYSWPGNYRQLKSYLEQKRLTEERSLHLTFGALESSFHYHHAIEMMDDSVISLQEMKKKYCKSAYYKSHGCISDTARKLGIARNTLKSILAS